MSVEFDTPANRIIAQFQPKNQFGIDTSLPNFAFLRQLSIQGRLTINSQRIISSTPIIITPPTGETQFIYRLVITVTQVATLTIVNDGVTRFALASSTAEPIILDYFDSLVGNGTKTIEFSVPSGDISVTIFGWKENTSRIRDVI